MEKVRLNVIQPADVRGRFHKARHVVFWALIALWAALPWIRIAGNPAVFLDVEERKFFLFGVTFNAQDTWLLFFLVTGVAFALVYMTALAGRVWCGWMCPQTVFLEGIFRRIERWFEGSHEKRARRDAAGWTFDVVLRKLASHALYVVASFVIAHIFLSYFVSLPRVFEMVRHKPSEHPEAFAWAFGMTALFYGNFARFRDKLCSTVCPYGRLQGALVDDDSLVVGYDARRGEPRGKAKQANAGDCVDCRRCVVVCPTGIDIRNGLQLECIACTACIDACDEIMDRLNRPRGLIRYDSTNGLVGRPKRLVRPRVLLYTALGAAGMIAASIAIWARPDYEAVVLRYPGQPYVIEQNDVKNTFDLHLVNKRSTPETFHIALEAAPDAIAVVAKPEVELDALGGAHVPIVIRVPRDKYAGDFRFRVRVERLGARDARVVGGTFVGARR